MSRRVLIIDTSVLCCLLKVPGKDTAGSEEDRWDHPRVLNLIEIEQGSIFVLPLASIIETGNHIAQSPNRRRELALELASYIVQAARADSPWAAFTEQADLWGADQLLALARSWPELASAGTSLGDATIKDVAEYYARAGFDVEIVTGDAGLKAYQPSAPRRIPRRRG